jgi:hypothetical protein
MRIAPAVAEQSGFEFGGRLPPPIYRICALFSGEIAGLKLTKQKIKKIINKSGSNSKDLHLQQFSYMQNMHNSTQITK